MAEIEFPCPGCGEVLEASEDMAGVVVDCPSCGKKIMVPDEVPEDKQSDLLDDDDAEMDEEVENDATQSCPSCGAELEENSVLCMECGFHLRMGHRMNTEFR